MSQPLERHAMARHLPLALALIAIVMAGLAWWEAASRSAVGSGARSDHGANELAERLDSIRVQLGRLERRVALLESLPTGDGVSSRSPRSANSVDDERSPTGSLDGVEALTARLEQLESALARVEEFHDATTRQLAPAWGAEQAAGPPDTEEAGDHRSAWASAEANAGPEWLEVDFEPAVAARAVIIRETYNPGAIVRVLVETEGEWTTVWSGQQLSSEPLREFTVALPDRPTVSSVRVELDTRLVEGWNEIDAVGLDLGATIQWGTSARASTTYATTTSRQPMAFPSTEWTPPTPGQ